MLDLEWITAELERRSEALPIEIALHLALSAVQSTVQAKEKMQAIEAIALDAVVIDPRGRVLLHARRGRATEEELVRSLGMVLFSLLAGERLRDRRSTPLAQLAEEGVPESIIRIVARAVARVGSRYRSLEEMLFDLERWMRIHRHAISPRNVADLLRRNRLLEHPRPMPARPRGSSGQWFAAPA